MPKRYQPQNCAYLVEVGVFGLTVRGLSLAFSKVDIFKVWLKLGQKGSDGKPKWGRRATSENFDPNPKFNFYQELGVNPQIPGVGNRADEGALSAPPRWSASLCCNRTPSTSLH